MGLYYCLFHQRGPGRSRITIRAKFVSDLVARPGFYAAQKSAMILMNDVLVVERSRITDRLQVFATYRWGGPKPSNELRRRGPCPHSCAERRPIGRSLGPSAVTPAGMDGQGRTERERRIFVLVLRYSYNVLKCRPTARGASGILAAPAQALRANVFFFFWLLFLSSSGCTPTPSRREGEAAHHGPTCSSLTPSPSRTW